MSRCQSRAPSATLRSLGLMVGFTLGITIAAMAQAPPEADGPKAVPAERLAMYFEFDGLDAHADAWHKTAAYRMFRETTADDMIESIVGQLFERLPAGDGPITNEQAAALAEHIVRNGFTAGLSAPENPKGQPRVILVLNRAAKHDTVRALQDRLGAGAETIERDGREIHVIHQPNQAQGVAWWNEGEDLVIGIGGGEADLDAVLAALKGDGNATSHPIRKALRAPADDMETIALAFVDLAAFPPMPEDAKRLGFDGLKQIEVRWGFSGEALASHTRIVAPSPRRGVLALIDQPTFGADSLPPITPGTTNVAIFSVDGTKVLDRLAAIPDARRDVNKFEEEFAKATGMDLRTDVLDVLGPLWAFSIQPGDPGGGANMMLNPPRLTAAVQTRKPEAFAKLAERLFNNLNKNLQADARGDAPPVQIKPYAEGETKGFLLDVPPEVTPLPPSIRPALILGKEYAALSLTPDLAKTALDAPANDEIKKAVAAAGDDLIAFVQTDPRGTVPELIANLPFFLQLLGNAGNQPGGAPWMKELAGVRVDPKLIPRPEDLRKYLFPGTLSVRLADDGLVIQSRQAIPGVGASLVSPVGIALLLPAVQSAREAARRTQCMNNLKQIGLAMHNYHDTFNHFPAAAIRDKDGKPLLSWRVAILPFIEQNALYNEFKLDEPWDSPHNKALIDRMPKTYACPSGTMENGLTPYQVFTGNGALFDVEKETGIARITDGTSNTLMVVEAKTGVSWTKPEDVPFNPEDEALPSELGSKHPGGFNALLADGSVYFLKNSIDLDVLRKLITKAGGEVVEFPR